MKAAIEAEKAVISSALNNEPSAYEVAEKLATDDFSNGFHKNVHAAICGLVGRGTPPDIVTVHGWLEQAKQDSDETLGQLNDIASEFFPRAALSKHIGIIKERSMRRKIYAACKEAAAQCADAGSDTADIRNKLCDMIYALEEKREDVKTLKEACKEACVEIYAAKDALEKGGTHGIMCGIPKLDRWTGGWKPGELIVLGARSSIGKTSMALSWARKAKENNMVLFFSLEMQAGQLAMRLLAADTGVPLSDMRSGNITQPQEKAILKSVKQVDDNMIVSDTFSQSVNEMMATAQFIRQKHGLGLVVVDYLQLIRQVEHRDSEVRALNAITRGMKLMAGELNVPIILLSQLSRAADQMDGRKSREPKLSDLRGSGSIEQDADVVILLHKENRDDTEADLIVAKQRNGPVGKIRLNWDAERTVFTEQEAYRTYTGPEPFAGAQG